MIPEIDGRDLVIIILGTSAFAVGLEAIRIGLQRKELWVVAGSAIGTVAFGATTIILLRWSHG